MEIEIKDQAITAEHVVVGEELLSFLEDWYTWATTTPDGRGHDYFAPYTGLCLCLYSWANEKQTNGKSYQNLATELKYSFANCGLDSEYPFGIENYHARHHDDTQHLDPIRLEWVKKTIEKTKIAGKME